jgi:hypothetical protein
LTGAAQLKIICAVKRWTVMLVAVVAGVAVSAPAAAASVTIGALDPPTNACISLDGSPVTWLQLGLSGGTPSAVPANGVITAWQVRSGSTPLTGLVFKAARPGTPIGTETIIGQVSAGPQTANAITTTPARVPVRAGDVIGMSFVSGDCDTNGTTGDSLGSAGGDVQPGQTANFADDTQRRLPIAATVEPDADGDGFGDETQDRCPGVAGTDNGCVPPPTPRPDTTKPAVSAVIAKSLKLSKRGAVSFFMTASESATGNATGTINVPAKLSKVVRFKSAAVKLAPGSVTKVTLKLSRRNLQTVRKALARHRKLRAKITVTVSDAAGNRTTKQLSPRLG